MTSLFHYLVLSALVISATTALARPPKKPRYSDYSKLVTNSPFTIKQVTIRGPVQVSPLERDWMLGGISPSGDGYSVTLINKKNRKDRVRFIPGFSSGAFKLLEVKQSSKSYKDSRVLVSKDGQKGWIGYDEKLIKVRASSVAKKPSRKTSSRSASSRGGPPIPSKSSRKASPRVRHVPRKK